MKSSHFGNRRKWFEKLKRWENKIKILWIVIVFEWRMNSKNVNQCHLWKFHLKKTVFLLLNIFYFRYQWLESYLPFLLLFFKYSNLAKHSTSTKFIEFIICERRLKSPKSRNNKSERQIKIENISFFEYFFWKNRRKNYCPNVIWIAEINELFKRLMFWSRKHTNEALTLCFFLNWHEYFDKTRKFTHLSVSVLVWLLLVIIHFMVVK